MPDANPPPNEGGFVQQHVERLLREAEPAQASLAGGPQSVRSPNVVSFKLNEFAAPPVATASTLDHVHDAQLSVQIELGRAYMHLEDVPQLGPGSVIPLDKRAQDPVDIVVDGRLVARGEVLVLDDNYCVRVAELIRPQKAAA